MNEKKLVETLEAIKELFKVFKEHQHTQDEAIVHIMEQQLEIVHTLDIILENQVGHQAICGDS